MSLPNHVIYPSRPWRKLLFVLLTVLVSASSVWFYMQQTNIDEREAIAQLRIEYKQLNQTHEALSKKYDALKTALMDKEQSYAIQQATVQKLQEEMTNLQDELVNLDQELTFYQNITQGTNTSELQIKQFQLMPGQNPYSYQYRLVITQGKKISKPITGKVAITIKGLQAGKAKTINLAALALQVRYVQLIEGQVDLPNDFKPQIINISLAPQNQRDVSKDFKWQTITTFK